MRQDNAFRASGEYSLVSARKKGLPPSGSTMGKSVTRTRSTFFARFLHGFDSPSVIDLDCRPSRGESCGIIVLVVEDSTVRASSSDLGQNV